MKERQVSDFFSVKDTNNTSENQPSGRADSEVTSALDIAGKILTIVVVNAFSMTENDARAVRCVAKFPMFR